MTRVYKKKSFDLDLQQFMTIMAEFMTIMVEFMTIMAGAMAVDRQVWC